ncbi:MAG TPA: hypothetical protein VKV57_07550 [bacterium]|nr:hypothetical protein [bacterium]
MNSPTSLNRKGRFLGAFWVYVGCSILFFGLPILRHPSQYYLGRLGADPTTFIWYMAWWPYALVHGLNPFMTHHIWAPTGIDLARTTSVPGASLFISPITASLGPIVAYNMLMLVALPLAAWTAFLLCWYLTNAFWPALLAGYLFGFSSYQLGHLFGGHMNLVLIFLVPVLVYLVLLRLDNHVSSSRFVCVTALALVLQFSISLEVFATATLFGGAALLLVIIFTPRANRQPIFEVGVLVAIAYALAALVVSPSLYRFFTGGFLGGPVFSPATFSSDALNILIPTPISLASHFLSTGNKIFSGNLSEGTAYLGLPLTAVIVAFGVARWRTRTGKLLVAIVAAIGVASLGPVLHVGGRTWVQMPWALFLHVPILNVALPVRFMGLAVLPIAVIVALWLAAAGPHRWVKWTLATLSVMALLPNVWNFAWAQRVDTPPFFLGKLYREYIPAGSTVLVIPFDGLGNAMLWQAQSGMYFRSAAGNVGFVPKEAASWPILDTFACATLIPERAIQLKAFLAAGQIQTIVVDDRVPGPWPALFGVLRTAPVRVGGVVVYRVPASILATYRNLTPIDMVRRVAVDQFSALISAADQYVARGLPLSELSLHRLEQLGLLPNWGCSASGSNTPGTRFWQHSALWAGPREDGRIGLAVIGSSQVLGGVVSRYGISADTVYFPYPTRFSNDVPANASGPLLMEFTRAKLHRTATEPGRTSER